MFKSKYDIYFAFCIGFMIVLSIYLGFQYTQQKNLDKYLLVMRDKISSMIPDQKDKEEFEIFFSDFVSGIEDNSVSSNEVEKLAQNVIEIRKEKTSLSKEDIEKLLPSFRSDAKAQVNPQIFEFNKLNIKDWKKLALNFEKSYLQCDTIRTKRKQAQELHKQLKNQIEIHTQISKKLKQNSDAAKEKIKEIEKLEIDANVEQVLLKELKNLKIENEKINFKILSLDEMQIIINKERKKLQQEIHYIDSLKSVKL